MFMNDETIYLLRDARVKEWAVLESRNLSNHKDDKHLIFTLCLDKKTNKLMSHLYNAEHRAFYEGKYQEGNDFTSRQAVMEYYATRN